MPRIYVHLLNPREHPDDLRRHTKPPTWETFGNRTQFTSLRGLGVSEGKLVGFVEEIERYTRTHELGDVLWPSYPIIYADNLDELTREIQERGLYLFDIWGYVPGSGPGGYWQQFDVPASALVTFTSALGERWLGMDNGEQDGRYVGGYASQMTPRSADRFAQYLNFQQHFERMCNDLGNRMSTLVSLNFGHYFVKEGVYTLIGAETAQALPNSQVYYAFIRGAGKQYGVPWFGNASIYNRWGFKNYGSEGKSDGYEHGPTKGSSLNLMKRLLYSHVLYNSMIVGFEAGWFEGTELSPLGRIQQAAHRWVKEHGFPGVMVTPTALLCDFFCGWSFPRHLYTSDVYRVWGNLPYEPGDYLTDGVLDMLYPGYQDASYFHDESGFLTPTPYSDAADALLSDAPSWLLERYPILVVAGALEGGDEIRDKLQAYVDGGGWLIITAGSLARLPGGVADVRVDPGVVNLPARQNVHTESGDHVEDVGFALSLLDLPVRARVIARWREIPAVVAVESGKGRMTVFASPFGIGSDPATPPPQSEVDKPLLKPYPLLKHVRAELDRAFRSVALFDIGDRLNLVVCRKSAGEYTLGVTNNALEPRPLRIESRCGEIESIQEIPIDASEKGAVGYLPDGFENAAIGASGHGQIAGGDVRVFSVRVRETGVEEIPHVAPPPLPRGRALPLRDATSIRTEVLRRPTFFEHFDGVVVSASLLRSTERRALERETGWLQRQGVRVIVDCSEGVNLYPDLRLIANVVADYERSLSEIDDILAKMAALGARDLLLSLHRYPENNFTREETEAAFESALRTICERAGGLGVTIHLRMAHGKPPWSLSEANRWRNRVGAENLRVAASAALLLASNATPESVREVVGDLGMWLVSAPQNDVAGKLWNAHAPIHGSNSLDALGRNLKVAPDLPVALDAIYSDRDAEYRDAKALAELLADR